MQGHVNRLHHVRCVFPCSYPFCIAHSLAPPPTPAVPAPITLPLSSARSHAFAALLSFPFCTLALLQRNGDAALPFLASFPPHSLLPFPYSFPHVWNLVSATAIERGR